MFHRRIRDRNCYVGEAPNLLDRYKFIKNCTCTPSDFEWYGAASLPHCDLGLTSLLQPIAPLQRVQLSAQ